MGQEGLVWITGAASGVGRHLVGAFLRRGYPVLASDINLSGMEAAAQEDGWPSDKLRLAAFDVCSPDAWEQAWAGSGEQSLAVLLNVAGYLKPGYLKDVENQEIDRHIDINVKGLIYGCRLAARLMDGKRGHIINFGSLASLTPTPGIPLYGCSKFAVRGVSLSMALELLDTDIAVTLVCPDAIQTPMLDLQLDYDEAALTFSGDRSLTVEDIESALFKRVLPKRPVEIALPLSRGLMAKTFSLAPGMGRGLVAKFRSKGLARQKALAARRSS